MRAQVATGMAAAGGTSGWMHFAIANTTTLADDGAGAYNRVASMWGTSKNTRLGSTLTDPGLVAGSLFAEGALVSSGTFTAASGSGFAVLYTNSTVTASGAVARGMYLNPTLVAAANNDALTGARIEPAFTPGARTGLTARAVLLPAWSTASFTTPADPAMLEIGVLTGTGATNAYSIKLGAGPTGATNNYLVHATNWQVTSAGIMAVGGATLSTSMAFIVPASTTAISSMRLPHGAAPTAPVDGDVWTTTAGLYVRINGGTVGPLS